MERRFENVRIWMWRYKSSRGGLADYIHFMADTTSWDVLIDSLRELGSSRTTKVRTFPARELAIQHDPTGFDESYSWFGKFRLEIVADDDSLKQMALTFDGGMATLTVHPAFIPKVIETFESVRAGGWDFGFGPETRRRSPFGVGDRDKQSLAFMFWQPLRGTQ